MCNKMDRNITIITASVSVFIGLLVKGGAGKIQCAVLTHPREAMNKKFRNTVAIRENKSLCD